MLNTTLKLVETNLQLEICYVECGICPTADSIMIDTVI